MTYNHARRRRRSGAMVRLGLCLPTATLLLASAPAAFAQKANGNSAQSGGLGQDVPLFKVDQPRVVTAQLSYTF